MAFSTKLKELRKERGYTMENVADGVRRMTGIPLSKGQISRYESGKEDPSLSTAVAIAAFLGVSLDYIMELSDDPQIRSMERMLAYVNRIKELRTNKGGDENAQ